MPYWTAVANSGSAYMNPPSAALREPVAALAASYGSTLGLAGFDLATVAGTLAAGVVLGWLGAWVACGRHLARGKPQ
jgi:cell division transport system permease protein